MVIKSFIGLPSLFFPAVCDGEKTFYIIDARFRERAITSQWSAPTFFCSWPFTGTDKEIYKEKEKKRKSEEGTKERNTET
jgi:hypothetical protein